MANFKFILLLLVLSLVAAPNSKIVGVAAAPAAGANTAGQQQQQPPMSMADEIKLYSTPQWVDNMAQLFPEIANVVHRPSSFYRRQVRPLGLIFRAIGEMPEERAADVRFKEKTFDAAIELMKSLFFRQLLVPSDDSVAARTAYDEDLARRRRAMAEVDWFTHHWPPDAPEMFLRLESFLQREMGPLEDVWFGIRHVPEKSADHVVRIKREGLDAAMELLEHKLELLLPDGCPNNADTGAGEVCSKEEARVAVKEMLKGFLDQLVPGGKVKANKVHDDL